jgi:hypothetical protein
MGSINNPNLFRMTNSELTAGNRIHITVELEQAIRVEVKTTEDKLTAALTSDKPYLTGYKNALKWVLEMSRTELDE